MITLTKTDSVEGGQHHKTVYVSVQQYDLVFATYTAGRLCSSHWLVTSGVSVQSLGYKSFASPDGGLIKGYVYEALAAGELCFKLEMSSYYPTNLDFYAAVLRPSERCTTVNTYMVNKSNNTPVWTDYLTGLIEGEFVLCSQFSGGDLIAGVTPGVDETPQAGHKDGTATWVVDDWALPEGSHKTGDGFFELVRITGAGTFRYYGPNPLAMRVTVQGDPAVQTPPTAANDSAETLMNVPVVINLLANDAAGDNAIDASTVVIQTGPDHGGITNHGDGTVTYSPTTDWCGEDTFTYTIKDTEGLESNSATVTVTVHGTPIANNDTAETDENTLVSITVTANDVAKGSPLDPSTVMITDNPDHGWLTKLVAWGHCNVRYTPAAGYTGVDAFKYKIQDEAGRWSNIATVTVTINEVPEPPPPILPPHMYQNSMWL